jgi:hypothetical protein
VDTPARPAINPHLTLATYGDIKPGDRIVKWPSHPTRPNAHLTARPVAEIIQRYRATGLDDRGLRGGAPRYAYYDYEVIAWRDTGGGLFDDRADEPVYIVPADHGIA